MIIHSISRYAEWMRARGGTHLDREAQLPKEKAKKVDFALDTVSGHGRPKPRVGGVEPHRGAWEVPHRVDQGSETSRHVSGAKMLLQARYGG